MYNSPNHVKNTPRVKIRIIPSNNIISRININNYSSQKVLNNQEDFLVTCSTNGVIITQ